jgi:glucan phosphoethanolaminetransferase (alkaline phosphatase superfamily)
LKIDPVPVVKRRISFMGRLRHPVIGAVLLCTLMLVLLAPLAWRATASHATGDLLHWQALGIALVFWLLWFATFGAVSRAVAWAVPMALIWWPAEMFMRHTYASALGPNVIGLVAGTNSAEALEVVRTFGSGLAVLFLPPLLLGLVTWWSMRGLRWRMSRSWRERVLLVGLGSIGCVWFTLADQDQRASNAGPSDALAGPASGFFIDSLSVVYPINGWIALETARRNSAVIRDSRARMDRKPLAPEPTGEAAAELLILVIGESSSAARWGLAGGPRATTPSLAKLEGLVFLHDVVAPAMATRAVVPSMVSWRPLVSSAGVIDPQPEPGLLAAFKEAGWSTAWISNQPVQGAFDNPIVFYALDAHHQRFINPGSFNAASPYDEALIPELDAALNEAGPNKRAAVVVHTLGSHFNYANRYPEQFDVFQPSLKTWPAGKDVNLASRQEALNAYDNSILYTDHVLDRIIANLAARRRPAALIYMADHGDDVPDGRCMTLVGLRTTASAARVPALVWISPELEARRPGITTRLREQASRRPLQAEWVTPTMMNLAGLRVPRHPAPHLLQEADRRTRSIHIMGRAVSFDAAEKAAACNLLAKPAKPEATEATTSVPAKLAE